MNRILQRSLVAVFLLLALLGPALAKTDCRLAQDLSGLHDRYFGFLSAQSPDLDRPVVRPIGTSEAKIAGLRARLADSRFSGDPSMEAALDGVLSVIRREQSALGAQPLQASDHETHMGLRAMFARALERTGCFPRAGGPSPPVVRELGTPDRPADPNEQGTILLLREVTLGDDLGLAAWFAVFPALGLAWLVGGRIRRKTRMRSFRRYPIHAVLEFDAGGPVPVRFHVVDISQGGLKIQRGRDAGAALPTALIFADRTLPLKLNWQNTHFTGLEFDRFLDLRELGQILRHAKAGVNENGAPGGAAEVPLRGRLPVQEAPLM